MRVVRLGAKVVVAAGLCLLIGTPAATALVRLPTPIGSSTLVATSGVPKAHPRRAAQENAPVRADIAQAAPVNQAASAHTARANGVPLPRPRPGGPAVLARVENTGAAAPVATIAYANPDATPATGALAAASGAITGVVPAAPALSSHAPTAAVPAPTFSRSRWSAAPLKRALDALKADRYDQVLVMRGDLKDPLDKAILDYFLTRSGSPKVPARLIADFSANNPGFPTPKAVRASLEAALSRENTAPNEAKRQLGGRAETPAGIRLLVRERMAAGDRAGATNLLRSAWHNSSMGSNLQASIAKEFGSLLSVDDHLIRVDRLVARNRVAEAKALKNRLGNGPRAYVDARIAAATASGDVRKRLAAVPNDLKRRPGYALAVAEADRRANKLKDAAKRLLSVNPANAVDGDDFWTEARITSRMLAEAGNASLAYQLASRGFAEGRVARADEAFHAGWYALEGLGDGRKADRHFADIQNIASFPISLSRGSYWQGRAAEKRGDSAAARRHYRAAAEYGFTYYGQLARETLRLSGTGVPRGPNITAADRAAMSKNALAEAVRRLKATGHEHRVFPFIDRLSETVPTAGQVGLTAQLARDTGYAHFALMAAKEGQRRGLNVGRLAYPTTEIPRGATVPVGLDRALVFSIARQESQFNTGAVSPAGARGLMQVMPRTGRSMARTLKMRHSTARLLSDPAYNATIGAHYLHKRLGEYDGSYILTFAAYNAGAGRVNEWIERFGDPRDPKVDAVNWVEQIPFPETRNYVMRILENVQVYREALGTGRLAINEDLARGRAS